MQKWEYLFVRADKVSERVNQRAGLPHQAILIINGRTEEVPQIPSKWEIAERYGEQGWELVAVNWNFHWDMVFKRPKN